MARVRIDLPERLPFRTEIPVRIGDINYAGHLGNDAVLSLVHEARIRYLQSLGFTELDVAGAGIIMIDAVVVYRSEAFYGDVAVVEVGTIAGGSVDCEMYYRITNAATGKEIARVKTGIVFFDYVKRKVLPPPSAFLERLRDEMQ
ncbi:MAG: thioesterase [Chlorobi bacterium]|nr:thioesterase [Chlorobiota bacterium]